MLTGVICTDHERLETCLDELTNSRMLAVKLALAVVYHNA